MTNYEIKPDIEPKSKYKEAKKALLEADAAIQALTEWEKEKLLQEYVEIRGIHGLYEMMKKCCR